MECNVEGKEGSGGRLRKHIRRGESVFIYMEGTAELQESWMNILSP